MKHFCFKMTGFYIVALVVISLSITGCFGGGGSSKSYTVSGKVVDGNGDGINGVEILVTGGKSTTTTTENGGKYALTGLTGTCTLTPILEGYTFEPNNREISKASTNLEFTGTTKPIEPEVNTLTVENGAGEGEKLESYWFSDLAEAWILGVFQNGKMLNPNREDSLGSFSGWVLLDIYAAVEGACFDEGEYLLLEMTTSEGVLTKLFRVG